MRFRTLTLTAGALATVLVLAGCAPTDGSMPGMDHGPGGMTSSTPAPSTNAGSCACRICTALCARRLGSPTTGHQPKGLLDLPHGRVFEREDTNRHSFEQIHIKGIDDLQPSFCLRASASKHKQIAQGVHP